MTYYILYRELTESLSAVSDCADFEAKCLLEYFYNISANDIYSGKECAEEEFAALKDALGLRLRHTPLQYIIGRWQFMDCEFLVDESVLIPRPETELLCECLENEIKTDTSNIVYDLCAGSGCVGISVAKRCGVKVYAFEKYDAAFRILKKNILLNSAQVVPLKHDINFAPPAEIPQADFILSNPPYVEQSMIESLQLEVRKEPHEALDGGADGLDFYRSISAVWQQNLKSGGYLALEIGENQAESVKEIFSSLSFVKLIRDYGGMDRTMIFRKGK